MYPAATARNRATDLMEENIGLSSFRANLLLGKFSGRSPYRSDPVCHAFVAFYLSRVIVLMGRSTAGGAVSIR